MARGGRGGRKPKGRIKKLGPDSADKAKGIKSLDELVGVSELVVETGEDEQNAMEQNLTEAEQLAMVSEWISTT